ncbi:hypothetical protein H2248_005850 [Termitomyces sp. 'cryptogamus']|nr:hypothetical protein H2248_005850 [Termitomyces sp. 'cryptogamus']
MMKYLLGLKWDMLMEQVGGCGAEYIVAMIHEADLISHKPMRLLDMLLSFRAVSFETRTTKNLKNVELARVLEKRTEKKRGKGKGSQFQTAEGTHVQARAAE